MTKVETLSRPTNLGIDPIEYNRGQLIQFPDLQNVLNPCYQRATEEKKPYRDNVVSVDWFSVNLSGQLPKYVKDVTDYELTEEIHLRRYNGNGTQTHEHLFDVYLNGELFGELKTHTRDPIRFGIDSMHFKLKNIRCTTLDWLDDFRYFVTSLNWSVKSLSQLDIAIDGIGAMKYKETLLKSIDPKCNVYLKGKAGIDATYSGKEVTSIRVGKRSSDKFARLYNKTKELNHSNKTYIRSFWATSGLKTTEDTYRFEIVLKSKALKSYDIWRLDDPEYLSSIFRTEVVNWADFYRQTTDTNKARAMKANKFELIDWKTLGADLLPKAKAKTPTDVYRAKQVIKNTLRFREVHGIKTLEELISKHDLQDYVDTKATYWAEDWAKEKARLNKFEDLLTTNLN